MVAPPTLLPASSRAIFIALTIVSLWPLLLPVRGSDETILIVPVNCPPEAAGAAAGEAAATGDALVAGEALAAGDETADGEELAAGDALVAGDAAATGEAEVAGEADVAGEAPAAGAVVGLAASVGLAGAEVGVVEAPDEQAVSSAAPPVRRTACPRNVRRVNREGRT
jgi:hypothetical protein